MYFTCKDKIFTKLIEHYSWTDLKNRYIKIRKIQLIFLKINCETIINTWSLMLFVIRNPKKNKQRLINFANLLLIFS